MTAGAGRHTIESMTTKRKRTPKQAGKAQPKTTGVHQAIPGAGKGGIVPPPEHRWQAGQTGNSHGRPRKMAEFQELIKETLAEDVRDAEGRSLRLTRAQAAIRVMFNKGGAGAIALFEYAFGKVPQLTHEMSENEWREWFIAQGYSESDANRAFESMVNAAANAVPEHAGSPEITDGESGSSGGAAANGDASLDA